MFPGDGQTGSKLLLSAGSAGRNSNLSHSTRDIFKRCSSARLICEDHPELDEEFVLAFAKVWAHKGDVAML